MPILKWFAVHWSVPMDYNTPHFFRGKKNTTPSQSFLTNIGFWTSSRSSVRSWKLSGETWHRNCSRLLCGVLQVKGSQQLLLSALTWWFSGAILTTSWQTWGTQRKKPGHVLPHVWEKKKQSIKLPGPRLIILLHVNLENSHHCLAASTPCQVWSKHSVESNYDFIINFDFHCSF